MIYIGSDHAGFKLKEELKKYLTKNKYIFEDIGPSTYKKNDDYPDYAKKLSKQVSKNISNKGILICGAGHGMNIVANKTKKIRASVCWNKLITEYARKHNNINVLCIPSRFINKRNAKKIIKTFLNTKFSKEKRHIRRIKKIENIK